MLENVIRRVRRLLLSGYYVVPEDWPAGNFRRWHSGTTLRSRFRLSDGGLALAFIRPFQLVVFSKDAAEYQAMPLHSPEIYEIDDCTASPEIYSGISQQVKIYKGLQKAITMEYSSVRF